MPENSDEDSLLDVVGIEWFEATPDPKNPGYYDYHDTNSEIFASLSDAVQRASIPKRNPLIDVNYWHVRCPSLDCDYDEIDWVEPFDGPEDV